MIPPECPRIGNERYRQRVANLTEDLEHQVQARTREAEAARDYFRSILLNSPVGIAFLDEERGIQQVNPALEEVVGRSAEALEGQDTECLYQDPSEFERVGREAYPTLKDGGVYRTVTTFQRPDGTSLTVSLTGRAVNPEALEEGFIWVVQDITEQRRLEAELQYQANHDPLTGAYNRRRATQLLEAEVERAQRYGTPFSVILLDIDHFKSINDRLGHDVGDSVLVEVTALAGQRLRELDLLARWGGEEFLIVLPETRQEGAERVAEDLRERVAATHFTGLGTLTISLGVAQLAEGQDIDGLTKQADEALYAAKAGGRNRVARAPG